MTNTIEEAAKDYAYDIGDSDWERMLLQDAFMDGAAYIMQLPLSNRLTAEEKENIEKCFQSRNYILTHQDKYEVYIVREAEVEMKLLRCLFPEIAKEVEE